MKDGATAMAKVTEVVEVVKLIGTMEYVDVAPTQCKLLLHIYSGYTVIIIQYIAVVNRFI